MQFVGSADTTTLVPFLTAFLSILTDWSIPRSGIIKLLGTLLDSNLNFKQHIISKCKTSMINIQRIKHIRKYLTQSACETLVHSLVMSHLDYTNLLMFGFPSCDINHLQHVQNVAGKMVLKCCKYDSTTNTLIQLHWLPVSFRIKFKILTLVYSCFNNAAPKYLQEMLVPYKTWEGLQSNNARRLLKIPRTSKHTFADRSFSVCGP